jgi:hypothetical protein
MKRVRILGYLYRSKEEDVFYYENKVEDDMRCYYPLDDLASVYVLNSLDHLQHIEAFYESARIWHINLFHAYAEIHNALAVTGLKCPFGTPTLAQWHSPDYKRCSFFGDLAEYSCVYTGPFYVFPTVCIELEEEHKTDIVWCIVHPEESERMERILNGTDNPLYDFVHELRYNPNISSKLGSEREEAQQDFNQKRARIE